MGPAIVRKVTIYPLRIPLRGEVEHAGAQRSWADPIVVEVELDGGRRGYGETLPRSYVTGETREDVLQYLRTEGLSALMSFNAPTFAEALEAIEALPMFGSGETTIGDARRAGQGGAKRGRATEIITPVRGRTTPGPAARASVELALLDACMKHFHRGVEDIVGWMGLVGAVGRRGVGDGAGPGRTSAFRATGRAAKRPRGSAVLATATPALLLRRLRWFRWVGFRDFKLKVGLEADEQSARIVDRCLGKALRSGRATLRLDANGAWSPEEAAQGLGLWRAIPLVGVEQPLPRGQEEQLPALRAMTPAPWIHDESLVDMEDARRLIALGVADVFNVRLSKCGGWLSALRLAHMARREGVGVQLGCMVGETSILSAAGLRFLEVFPHVEWVEGCFGTWLLRSDVVRKSLRLGYAGRLPSPMGPGWGLQIDEDRLRTMSDPAPVALHLG